jgi:glycosyltransferase involved in cell wall biosynthesis
MFKDKSVVNLSVVIPCYNHGEFLPDAVASVTACDRTDVELIVVDDGSTDDRTRRAIDNLDGLGMEIIRQPNKGLAGARNAGIAVARGRYILPLDADNRIRAAYIEHGIRILDANPKVGVVYGDAEYIGTRSGRWSVGPFDENRLLGWNYIDACAIYRRAVWQQNGGYDGTMPVQGFEDWDFWIGAVEHGWDFSYVPEIVFDYRVAENSMITHAVRFEREVEEFVGKKHGPFFRKRWSRLMAERQSIRVTSRTLRGLIAARVKSKIQPAGANGRG